MVFKLTFRAPNSTLDLDLWVKDIPEEKKSTDTPCVYIKLYNTKKEIFVPMTISPNPQILGKYGRKKFNPLLQNNFGSYRVSLIQNFVSRNWEILMRHWFGVFGNKVLIKSLLQSREDVK